MGEWEHMRWNILIFIQYFIHIRLEAKCGSISDVTLYNAIHNLRHHPSGG